MPKRITDCGTSRSTTTFPAEPWICVVRHRLERAGLGQGAEGAGQGLGEGLGTDGADRRDLDPTAADDPRVHREQVLAGDRRDALQRAEEGRP